MTTKSALKSSSSNTPPITSITDIHGNPIPFSSLIINDKKNNANTNTINTSFSSSSPVKKTVSFHADTKPPSEDFLENSSTDYISTDNSNNNSRSNRSHKNRIKRRTRNVNSKSAGQSKREEYLFVLLDYLMVIVPLTSVYIVLDVLVYRQYDQDLISSDVLHRAVTAFGTLFVLHSTIHPLHASLPMQMLLLFFTVILASYLVHACYHHDYFAVMKQAPPLGTVLVWLSIELEYYWSILAGVTVAFLSWLIAY
ncbi:hypothetical protein V1514DRAFT_282497 [Lipomyces japonicus]|uniref:uncharacterized protein n=1 Tax=Lipomyces japonicus TaxID=56871 RepID=UPI0034CEB830